MRAALLMTLLLLGAPAARAEDARTLLQQGRILEAMPVAEREATARPNDVEAQERWIDLLLGLGLAGEAVDHARRLVAARPDQPDPHYLLGRAQPDTASSRAAFEDALRLDPNHARAWTGIGALERAANQPREAASAYQRALRTDPALAEAWGGLLAVVSLGDDPAAIAQVAEAARAAVPDSPAPWLTLAAIDPTRAGAVLREGVQRVPWDARLLAALSEQLLREGDLPAARAAAERALAFDPRHRGARFAVLLVDARLSGQLTAEQATRLVDARGAGSEAAGPILHQLVAAAPRSALVRVARATWRLAAGDTPGARADLEAGLAAEPGHPEAAALLGTMIAEEDPARAAALLGPVATRRPDDARLAATLGRARIATGLAAEAVSDLAAAAAHHPYDVEIHLVHAHARSASGDLAGAWRVASEFARRRPEPAALLAWAAAARDAGHLREAADVYAQLAERTGDPRLSQAAASLRARAAAAEE